MSYPGGKQGSGVYQQIINRIPPHEIYIEPFLGGGAIMKMKRPALASIGIDIDLDVVKAFDQGTTPNLTLLERNALDWLSTNTFTPSTFIYCDPPYLFCTRSTKKRIYRNELYDGDHIALLRTIKLLPCMTMISGYPNTLYDEELRDWWLATFKTTNRAGGHVTEKLWMNYPPPIRLHDYRYLGNTFREREKIKRQRQRWVMRLEKMDEVKRHALAAAIAELETSGQHQQETRTAPGRHETKEEVINALCEGFNIPPPTQHMVVNPAGRGLQDHNILWSPDPIDKDAGTRSTEPMVCDLRSGRSRRLLRQTNPKTARD